MSLFLFAVIGSIIFLPLNKMSKVHLNILTGLLTFFNFFGAAQTWVWAKPGHVQAGQFGACHSNYIDNNNNLFIGGAFHLSLNLGATVLTESLNGCGFIAKLDTSGNTQWAEKICGTSLDFGLKVCADLNGNSFLAGALTSPTLTIGPYTLTRWGSPNVYIAKYDGNGNVLWAKTILGPTAILPYEIANDQSGNLYVTGAFSSSLIVIGSTTVTNTNSCCDEVFLAKFDQNGNLIWLKTLKGIQNDRVFDLCVEPNGNSYITGSFLSPNLIAGNYTLTNSSPTFYDAYLVKFDAGGNVAWAKSMIGSDDDVGYSVSANANAVVVTGNYKSPSLAFSGGTITGQYWNSKFFVAKYDVNGNFNWAKTNLDNGSGYSVSVKNSGIYVSGNTIGPCSFGTTTLNFTDNRTFVVDYDMNGNEGCLTAIKDGGGYWSNVVSDHNGNAFIVSTYDSNPLSIGSNNMGLTGTKDIYFAKYHGCLAYVGLKENSVDKSISVFPNPNSGFFKIKLDNEIENGEFMIIDLVGRKTYSSKINRGENSFELHNIPSGLYHYVILQNKEQINRGKLVIE